MGAYIDTSYDSGTSTLKTYFSKFIARQLYAQKSILAAWGLYMACDMRNNLSVGDMFLHCDFIFILLFIVSKVIIIDKIILL